MKKTLIVILFVVSSFSMFGQCSLFFSEYIEGSSNNKAVEIYNPTTSPVDLSEYKIYRYNNGAAIPTDSLTLTGTLASHAVYIAGNPSAITAITDLSDTLHTITFFNGDDVLELRYLPTQTSIDIFGQIGVDPGTNWPVGTGATSEFTLVRTFAVNNGETNWAVCATEWEVYPQNTTTYLGSHSCASCCTATPTSESQTACDSYTWTVNGATYSASGSYSDTLITPTGCDSVVTLNLTINYSATGVDVQTACDLYQWIDGNTYTASNNTATHTIAGGASNGCDSVVTLNLTISYSVTATDVQTACDSYQWIDGNTYTASNNTATHIIAGGAASGCDSVITLSLTLNYSATGTDVQTACGSYLWIDGNTYTADNNSAIHVITGGAANGCDSVVTLNLTILPMPVTSVTQVNEVLTADQTGADYQWIDCNNSNTAIPGETGQTFTALVNGDYAIVLSMNGCADTSDCINVNTVSVQHTISGGLTVYPNPAGPILTVSGVVTGSEVTIADLSGKVLLTETAEFSTECISMKDIPEGVYILKVTGTDGVRTIKIIR